MKNQRLLQSGLFCLFNRRPVLFTLSLSKGALLILSLSVLSEVEGVEVPKDYADFGEIGVGANFGCVNRCHKSFVCALNFVVSPYF